MLSMSVVIVQHDPGVFKHRQHFIKKSRHYGTQSSSSLSECSNQISAKR